MELGYRSVDQMAVWLIDHWILNVSVNRISTERKYRKANKLSLQWRSVNWTFNTGCFWRLVNEWSTIQKPGPFCLTVSIGRFNLQWGIWILDNRLQDLSEYWTVLFTCKAPERGWSHVLYVHVCIRGRKGDDDALSSLGPDVDALSLSWYSSRSVTSSGWRSTK